MKKKFITVMLAAALAGTLAGCSGELSNDYVTVKQYKGLEVPQPTPAEEVTDDQVEQVIQSNLAAYAQTEEVTDRAAEMGDIVNIDYTGYLDGTAFDGGSAEGADLELGSNSFIGATDDYKGFEEQIAGHQTGDEFDITVQFPDPYDRNPDMSGAVADFHIVLNSISQQVTPELTDEWVKEISDESETVDEYREEIRSQIEENTEASIDSELESSVQSALMDNVEIKKYPEDRVEELTQQMTDYYTQLAGMYGLELGEFVETYMQMSEDDFNAQIDESVRQGVALEEALKLIAEKRHLEPTDEEYEEGMAEYAEQAGYDDVDEYTEQVGEDELKAAVLRDKVTDYLVDNCIQVEQTDTAE